MTEAILEIDAETRGGATGEVSATPVGEPWLQVLGSRYVVDWLQQQRCSLAFTTYQTGKLFLVGRGSADFGVRADVQSQHGLLGVSERSHAVDEFRIPTVAIRERLARRRFTRRL